MFSKSKWIRNNNSIVIHSREYSVFYSNKLFRPKIKIDIIIVLQWCLFKIRPNKQNIAESKYSINRFPISDNKWIEIVSRAFQSKFFIKKSEYLPVPTSEIDDRASFLQLQMLLHDTQMIVKRRDIRSLFKSRNHRSQQENNSKNSEPEDQDKKKYQKNDFYSHIKSIVFRTRNKRGEEGYFLKFLSIKNK